jgi:hypothetical protein
LLCVLLAPLLLPLALVLRWELGFLAVPSRDTADTALGTTDTSAAAMISIIAFAGVSVETSLGTAGALIDNSAGG